MAAISRDFNAFCAWLAGTGRVGRDCAVAGVAQPKTGFSADTLLLDVVTDAGPRAIVVRIEHTGRHMFRDSSPERQARMMDLLRGAGVPAPMVLGWSADATILGGPFLVMEACAGVSLPQHPSYHVAGLLIDLAPAQRAHAWHDALGVMARINRIDWRAGAGFLIDQLVPLGAIVAVEGGFTGEEVRDSDTFNAALLAWPNIMLRLDRPLPRRSLLKKRGPFVRVAFRLDDPEPFTRLLVWRLGHRAS